MGHITFTDGVLSVKKEQQALQKLLSLYHPLKLHRYRELEPQKVAISELDELNFEIDALNAAKSMDIEHAEAVLRVECGSEVSKLVLRVECGSEVSKLSSKEIKRDLLLFAKNNPSLFIELANDENVVLRNFGIKATEANVIKLSDDQRYFMWASNGKKLMTIPFDENPYSAFAAFLKTDEGVQIYKSIEKKFK